MARPGGGRDAPHRNTDLWQQFFDQNFPQTTTCLYLIDESVDYAQTERWAGFHASNDGPGRRMKSFATGSATHIERRAPSVDSVATAFILASDEALQSIERLLDGPRGFVWESTYYRNFQGGQGDTDVFEQAQTFGSDLRMDPVYGRNGVLYANGDGVLFYTDTVFPNQSHGPFASLRLKHWRRGLQDVEYLALAQARDPNATRAIINRVLPRTRWEYGVSDPRDPTFVYTDISRSTAPDVWEDARRGLAAIIVGE